MDTAKQAAQPHVSVRLLYPFAAALSDEGVDLESLLAEAGVPWSTYRDPDSRVPYLTARRFHFAAAQRSHSPALGLAAARHFAVAQFQVLEYFVASSTHLASALDALVDNEHVMSDLHSIRVERRAEGVLVRVEAASTGAHRCWFEFAVGTIYLAGRRIGGAPAKRTLETIPWFAYAAPPCVAEYEAFFEGSVRFDAPATGLLIPPEALQHRLESADTRLRDALDVYLKRQTARPGAQAPSFLDRARELLGGSLSDGDPGMDAIAARLNMSRSTLRRRLRQAGATYRSLLQGVRRDLALKYLQRSELGIDEVASLVGYDDSTAFHRAFKKWTGNTPAEHRTQMRPGPRSAR